MYQCRIDVAINDLSGRSYPILLGDKLISTFSSDIDRGRYSKIAIVADTQLPESLTKAIDPSFIKDAEIFLVGPGESAKNLLTVEKLWSGFFAHGLDRKSLVICLGGGSTLDVGAFAASTYMRGIRFVHIPTTLLAQADASIGGKTGINLSGSKNLVGTFCQPDAVIIDPSTLSSLNTADFSSGLAEIVKHAAIRDQNLFHSLEQLSIDQLQASDRLLPILTRSCEIKRAIVVEDPSEKHVRRLLNFGHTFGHIIEARSLSSNKPLRHGEAVAIGMVGEAKIAALMGLCSNSDLLRLEALLSRYNLPTRSSIKISTSELQQDILKDKKTSMGCTNWPLIRGIGDSALDVEVAAAVSAQGAGYISLVDSAKL